MQVYTLQGFDQKYTIFQHNSMIIEQIQKSRGGGGGGCDIFITCKEIDHASEFFWLTVNFFVP